MKIIPAIFEEREIRRLYDEKTETWFFSVVDIIQILTQQPDFQTARKYWNKLKERLGKEGSQLVTNCHRFKLPADDGKMRLTDVANAETLLRLVQSVPSPKAEPIKLWLAKVGYERMQEMSDPARALERARTTWQQHGRSEKWIQQRMTGQETRNKLTDYWADHDIKKGEEYAILTNLIHQEWSGVSVKSHKELKGLKTQNLRDHMSEAELIFTALAELSTRQIAETTAATGMAENQIHGSIYGGVTVSGFPFQDPGFTVVTVIDQGVADLLDDRADIYGDAVQELDWSSGEILRALKKLELDQNTLVFFMSANGPNTGTGGKAGPLRGGKGSTLEGGVRVPFVAHLHGSGGVARWEKIKKLARAIAGEFNERRTRNGQPWSGPWLAPNYYESSTYCPIAPAWNPDLPYR